MPKNRFQGDPKLFLTQDGVDLHFVSGQPVMDAGFENQVMISLFTKSGWWGNSLISNIDQQIGSDFEDKAKGSINLKKLSQVEQDAERVLKYRAFGNIQTTVVNPESQRLDMTVLISPPGQDVQQLRLTRNSQNWQNQTEQGA